MFRASKNFKIPPKNTQITPKITHLHLKYA